MPAALPDRRTILAIAALADVDPRTVARYIRGGARVHPAIAHAIERARGRASLLVDDADDNGADHAP